MKTITKKRGRPKKGGIKKTLVRPKAPATIQLIKEDELAPYIRVDEAIKRTGVGESLVRSLKLRKFGKTHYVKVTELNEFILNYGEKELRP